MKDRDFSGFSNVELIGVDLSAIDEEQLSVLYRQARYCQAMTDADTDTLREIVAPDTVFTHMSGRRQSREEYFADIARGALRYFTIGIDHPIVSVNGNIASITYTSVLNANAYGARGTFRMHGTHWFEKRDGEWISVNQPDR
ncbi:MAG: nuclear transport factor 2 family protein [Oscillospiraceae bacterium]|nr:nuclear transport factor 2 family protein [Oscillospiraceae bacterium]